VKIRCSVLFLIFVHLAGCALHDSITKETITGSANLTSKTSSIKLKRIKTIRFKNSDPLLSSVTLEKVHWSPDGKRIAVIKFDKSSFAIADVETGTVSDLDLRIPGFSDKSLNWSSRLNNLAITAANHTRVLNMATAPPETKYFINNVFPKVLIARGANIIQVKDEDWLLMGGTTTWSKEKENPHIAAYDIKSGELRGTFQFSDQETDETYGNTSFFIKHLASQVNNEGDVIVAVVAQHVIKKAIKDPYPTSEHAVWIINLTKKKIHCKPNIFDSNIRYKEGIPTIEVDGNFYGIDISRDARSVVLSHTQFSDVYDVQSCERRVMLDENLSRPFNDKRRQHDWYSKLQTRPPDVGHIKISPDGRWMVGYSFWAPNPEKAPLRIWRTSDWSLIYDGTFPDEGGPWTAAFSYDGNRLAVATHSKLVIYEIVEEIQNSN
jgi:hypothetical protein